jgi:drug/metabolite transporter (DMT)-like permease
MDAKTLGLTTLALIAFASNSILTRLALGSLRIDAATFSLLRLVSGALVLAVVVRAQSGAWTALRGRMTKSSLALVSYAVPFSFAYLRIGAALGALVLFGVVQLTMIGYGVSRGERLQWSAWFGLSSATAGLLALTVPSAAAQPDLIGLLLMTIAGVAWAAYSIFGKAALDPVAANAHSFVWSCPPALAITFFFHDSAIATAQGVLLAMVSGGITSGLGYAVWYRALVRLKITHAAVAQLTVPVIAAFGAVAFLDESLSARLLLSSAAVLGGVSIVLMARSIQTRKK